MGLKTCMQNLVHFTSLYIIDLIIYKFLSIIYVVKWLWILTFEWALD